MLSHLLCVQLILFRLIAMCHTFTLHPAMCLASNWSCLHPGQEQEHADSERQGPHVHQEVGAWQAEQTQDPGQHQEEVHQWRVRCFLYIMHCWCLWRICFLRKKELLHSSSFREIRSKSHEETRQFQENFEVRWFLFPYFFIDLQFLMTKHLHQLCRCTCKPWSLNVSTRTSSLRFSLKKVNSMSIGSMIYLGLQGSISYFKTKK